MVDIQDLITSIQPVDNQLIEKVQSLLDNKTKPRRSLGRLEELACRFAAARHTTLPALPNKAVVVMAADHGVAAEGVSAYPQEVTQQMVLNFAHGGAAINAIARQVDAALIVVDMGVAQPLGPIQGVRQHRIGPGTRNMVREPSMTIEQTYQAISVGAQIAQELADSGVSLIGTGEMGIANTTSASALVAALTQSQPADVTGRGTGIDDKSYANKVATIERALALHRPDPNAPLSTLAALGGFEIAGLTGVVLGAAANRVPVMIDGFISSAAALCAFNIAPAVGGYLIASHRSVEAGHDRALGAMGLHPLFDLQMRLGEGTGAALAMNLVDVSVRILKEMATFESAQVADTGA